VTGRLRCSPSPLRQDPDDQVDQGPQGKTVGINALGTADHALTLCL
jgi:hypothetical protein